VTVHTLEAPPDKLLGAQFTETSAGTRLRVTLLVLLPRVPVTVADWTLVTVPAVALNVAEVAPDATLTDAGTVRVAFVFVRVTFSPPVGAICVSVTVQVLEAFAPRVVGTHASEESITGATSVILALAELPLYVAVIVAL